MPLRKLIKYIVGTCRYCRQRAGIFQQDYPDCQRAQKAGWQEMVELAADGTRSHNFDEKSLRLSLATFAQHPENTVDCSER